MPATSASCERQVVDVLGSPQVRPVGSIGFRIAGDLAAVIGPLLGVLVSGWVQGRAGDGALDPFRVVSWPSVIPGLRAVMAFLIRVRELQESGNAALTFGGFLRGLGADPLTMVQASK